MRTASKAICKEEELGTWSLAQLPALYYIDVAPPLAASNSPQSPERQTKPEPQGVPSALGVLGAQAPSGPHVPWVWQMLAVGQLTPRHMFTAAQGSDTSVMRDSSLSL